LLLRTLRTSDWIHTATHPYAISIITSPEKKKRKREQKQMKKENEERE
jgi:hypothetical protein